MLSINCIRCTSGPGSIASRGFCLERKLCPGIGAQNGVRFPDRPSTGNCVPEFGSKAGCALPLAWVSETASRNQAWKWDALSEQVLKRKLHPGIDAQNGMRFPERTSTGNCVPDLDLRPGPAFRNASTEVVLPPRISSIANLNANFNLHVLDN